MFVLSAVQSESCQPGARAGLVFDLRAAGHADAADQPTLMPQRPLPFLKAYAYLGHTPADFPVVARHSREIISLPVYPELTNEQQHYVTETIRRFFK